MCICVGITGTYIGRELGRELLKLGELWPDVYTLSIEENGENGLCGTCVVDHLTGEEHRSCGIDVAGVSFVLPLE
jgi:hypothetical protein